MSALVQPGPFFTQLSAWIWLGARIRAQINAETETVNDSMSGMADYYQMRGSAVETLTKPSKEGVKPVDIPDLRSYILSLDVDTYKELRAQLEGIQEIYILVGDLISKNKEKILTPRAQRTNNMMF